VELKRAPIEMYQKIHHRLGLVSSFKANEREKKIKKKKKKKEKMKGKGREKIPTRSSSSLKTTLVLSIHTLLHRRLSLDLSLGSYLTHLISLPRPTHVPPTSHPRPTHVPPSLHSLVRHTDSVTLSRAL
jgi:hypothetical protein